MSDAPTSPTALRALLRRARDAALTPGDLHDSVQDVTDQIAAASTDDGEPGDVQRDMAEHAAAITSDGLTAQVRFLLDHLGPRSAALELDRYARVAA